MVLLLAVGAALAGMVAAPPADADEVAVLLCEVDACSDRMFWVTHEPRLDAVPVVAVDALLAAEVAARAGGDEAGAAWTAALDRARTALLAERWGEAERALDDAERLLRGWRGTAENADLFALWYMRGAAGVASGRSNGATPFAQAAALAWNRSVAPPEGLERWADPYYAAVEELLEQPVGTLTVEAAGGAELFLDGVSLGAGPARVLVFPGVHRLSAVEAGGGAEWAGTVTVAPGRTTTARPRFSGGEDPRWLLTALEQSVDTRRLDPAAAELLGRWAERHGLRAVRLLRLDPVDGSAAEDDPRLRYRLVEAWYQPGLRRFSATRP